MNTTIKKRNQPALSIYLGPPEVAAQRLDALARLAEQLGVSRSEMIQMLADGKLGLMVTRPRD